MSENRQKTLKTDGFAVFSCSIFFLDVPRALSQVTRGKRTVYRNYKIYTKPVPRQVIKDTGSVQDENLSKQ